MNVEDSYEGALRRLERLRLSGLHFGAPPPEPEHDERDRMRDLEELASLACDENERLKQELACMQSELEQLRQRVAELDRADETMTVPKRPAAFYFFIAVVVVGAIAFLLILHPWTSRPLPTASLPSTPVVAAPPPAPAAPKVEPTIPKVTTTIPKLEPSRVAVTKAPRRHVAKRHPSKHAQKKKRTSMAKSTRKLDARSNDPLSGLGM